jgi:hypothetical protein
VLAIEENSRYSGRTKRGNQMSIFQDNPLKFWDGKTNDLNPSDRYMSAEIEVAHAPNDAYHNNIIDALDEWSASSVRDGSLPSTGFEINTAPASGDMYIKQLDDICDSLKKAGGFVNNSCGLHVHVDARDYNYEKMLRYIKLWNLIENGMFSLVPASRANSGYCAKIGDHWVDNIAYNNRNRTNRRKFAHTVDDVLTSVYDDSAATAAKYKTSRRPGQRYKAINIHSWVYRGTIENRMHSGTVDAWKIAHWSILNATIIECAAQISDENLNALSTSLKKDVDHQIAFLVSISPVETGKFVEDRYRFFQKVADTKSAKLVEQTER